MKTNNLPSPVAFLNSDINERNNNGPYADLLKSGYANGYVALPPGHPLHGKNLIDSFINVHGGITFNDWYSLVKERFTKIDFIDDSSDLTDEWWVVGFDTCHCFDSLERWPKEAVIAETLKLKKELCTISDL